jgi:hypothetical protein
MGSCRVNIFTYSLKKNVETKQHKRGHPGKKMIMQGTNNSICKKKQHCNTSALKKKKKIF